MSAGAIMCSQSLCIWAKASCMPRVCSISPVSATRERTMPSRPRQPSTATTARMRDRDQQLDQREAAALAAFIGHQDCTSLRMRRSGLSACRRPTPRPGAVLVRAGSTSSSHIELQVRPAGIRSCACRWPETRAPGGSAPAGSRPTRSPSCWRAVRRPFCVRLPIARSEAPSAVPTMTSATSTSSRVKPRCGPREHVLMTVIRR
jgi:hypothetical protein